MASKKKNTLVAPMEWWKHLRPYNKRKQNKAERKAWKREIEDNQKDC